MKASNQPSRPPNDRGRTIADRCPTCHQSGGEVLSSNRAKTLVNGESRECQNKLIAKINKLQNKLQFILQRWLVLHQYWTVCNLPWCNQNLLICSFTLNCWFWTLASLSIYVLGDYGESTANYGKPTANRRPIRRFFAGCWTRFDHPGVLFD